MTLKKYLSKRDLSKSHEPATGSKKAVRLLNFVVQKHDARNLHYDFRLEYKGVLLSWAVPKGPSLDPKDKRLAVQVEDHPLDYQYFAGIIPKGNYGAGTVEIWDHGTYSAPHATTRNEVEKYISAGLKKGHFAVILNGSELNGEYIFEKLKKDSKDDHNWLLIKKDDTYATSEKKTKATSKDLPAKKSKMPAFIKPMLAVPVQKPFNDEEWLFEVKWDGYRAFAFINKGKVELKSRTDQLWTQKFHSITHALEKVAGQVILDGELVILDEKGKSDFQDMQNFQKTGKGTLIYYVFDLLYFEGKDIRDLPLIKRKELLKSLIKDIGNPLIRFSDHVIEAGESLFKAAKAENLEGIVGKKLLSPYLSKRSADWVKIKSGRRQEFVVGGFTEPKGSRNKLGALLVGVYNQDGELEYSGHVGGGFSQQLLEDVYRMLTPLIQTKCPFHKVPKANDSVTWVKPKLVAEVAFAEWTKENILRQPIFHGIRTDKMPKTIKKEIAEPVPQKEEKENVKKTKSSLYDTQATITHPEKLYWPKEKITKGDLIDYYTAISPYILPYLKDRPIMLHRYPDGIEDKSFYQKDLGENHPDWIETFPVQHEGKLDHYLLIKDLSSLQYAINLGSIDLHPFMSRCEDLLHTDYCVLDLDPHDIDFKHVIEVALEFHRLLTDMGVDHYCKTSGGKGLHILVPLHSAYDFDQSRQFAEIVAHFVHEKFSTTTSLERDPKKRPKKIYLDCLQNRRGQTIVAPYSVRPRPHAQVSTPLEWKEVNGKLKLSDFTMKTVPQRLEKVGDILLPILKKGVNLKKALDKLKKLTS